MNEFANESSIVKTDNTNLEALFKGFYYVPIKTLKFSSWNRFINEIHSSFGYSKRGFYELNPGKKFKFIDYFRGKFPVSTQQNLAASPSTIRMVGMIERFIRRLISICCLPFGMAFYMVRFALKQLMEIITTPFSILKYSRRRLIIADFPSSSGKKILLEALSFSFFRKFTKHLLSFLYVIGIGFLALVVNSIKHWVDVPMPSFIDPELFLLLCIPTGVFLLLFIFMILQHFEYESVEFYKNRLDKFQYILRLRTRLRSALNLSIKEPITQTHINTFRDLLEEEAKTLDDNPENLTKKEVASVLEEMTEREKLDFLSAQISEWMAICPAVKPGLSIRYVEAHFPKEIEILKEKVILALYRKKIQLTKASIYNAPLIIDEKTTKTLFKSVIYYRILTNSFDLPAIKLELKKLASNVIQKEYLDKLARFANVSPNEWEANYQLILRKLILP